MVLERDFVIRLIRQAVQFVAAALKLRAEDREAEAQEKLNEACRLLVGIDLERAVQLSPESLMALLADSRTAPRLASVLRHAGHKKPSFMLYDLLDRRGLLEDADRADFAALLDEM